MAYDEVSQLRGTTAQIANYKGYPAQLVQNTETGKMGVMQGDTAGNIKYLANEEQLTPLATKEELKPLAKDAEVLKLIAQNLTPEQKAQILKNLEGTFLPLIGGALNGSLVVKSDIWPTISMSDNTGSLGLCGGSGGGSEQGAKIDLNGADNSGGGSLSIQAGRSNEYSRIDMSPDGTLTQDGKDIEVVDSKGNKWIRFKSGLQICWEHHINYSAKTEVHNFPVPFSSVPVTLVDGLRLPYSHDWSTTAINVSTSNANLAEYCWLAVGWWK